MSININKRPKEPTALEKRNTSIVNFALVALIPILLCLLLGFSLGNADTVTRKQLNQTNQELLAKIESLEKEKAEMNDLIIKLESIFSKADTTFIKFDEVKVREITKSLKDIEGNKEEVDYDLRIWEKEMEDDVDDFIRDIENIQLPSGLTENSSNNRILILGKNWIKEYAKTKQNELSAQMLLKKKDFGIEIVTNLQDKIDELKGDLIDKDFKLRQLMAGEQKSNEKINNFRQDQSDAAKELDKLKQKNGDIKRSIMMDLQDLQENLLPTLTETGVLKCKPKGDLEVIKDKLEAKLDNIDTASQGLEVE